MCLLELCKNPDIEMIGAYLDEPGWWGTDEWMLLDPLGLRELHPRDWINWPQRPDLVFSVLTNHVFLKSEIGLARVGIVNLHPAPLPEHRGCNGYAHAIMDGDEEFGASLHWITEDIDRGPVIARTKFPISGDETGETLYEKAHMSAYRLFCESLPTIVEWASIGTRIPAMEQDERKAKYHRRDSLADKSLERLDEEAVDRKRRALKFHPFPGAE